MRKMFTRQLILCFALTFSLLIGGFKQANANHAMGADISYQCIDSANRVYSFTVNFYRDCAGNPAPTLVMLYGTSSCSAPLSLTLNALPCGPAYIGQPCEASPLCPAYLEQSTCNGGTLPGVQAYKYTGQVTLPVACTDWTFYIDIPARNKATTNLLNPSDNDLYIEVVINNVLAPKNSAPQFTASPVPVICVNQSYSYNQGAVDADGDSLVYTLVNPLTLGAVPIAYNSPFTPTTPMSVSGAFVFSNSTGQMDFVPNTQQVGVVALLIQEYRNGQLIGSTMRDMEFVVANLPGCTEPAPDLVPITSGSLQGGLFVDSAMVEVCKGNNLSIRTSAYTTPDDSVYMSSNIAQVIPGAVLNTTYIKADSITGTFTIPTAGLATGLYTFTIQVKNNNCPLLRSQVFVITVNVLGGTYAGADVTYCPSVGPVQLHAVGGTKFSWSPVIGLSDTSIAAPFASPPATTTYIVISNLNENCKNKDTVVVTTAANFDIVVNPVSDTVCAGSSTPLQVSGGNTYNWQQAGADLTCIDCSNPIARPTANTTYYVTISDSTNGCMVTDSIKLTVQNMNLSQAFSDTTVNGGDSLTMAVVANGDGAFNYTWSPLNYLDNADSASVRAVPLAPVTYTVYVSNGVCMDSAIFKIDVLLPDNLVKIPSGFTPNNDTYNDRFEPLIYNNLAAVKEFRIYNRLGQVVHNSTSPWDGRFNNAEQPAGTYVYYVVVAIPEHDDLELQGSVSLIR